MVVYFIITHDVISSMQIWTLRHNDEEFTYHHSGDEIGGECLCRHRSGMVRNTLQQIQHTST